MKASVEVADQQFKILSVQADILERQQGLARAQFFAEHRPRVVLRDVFFMPSGDVLYELVNVGGSAATITGGYAVLAYVDNAIDFKDPQSGRLLSIVGREIAAREFLPVQSSLPPEFEHRVDLGEIIDGVSKLHFFGAFTYADERGDEFGIKRLTVFRRRWGGEKSGFIRTGSGGAPNPDHEFAD